MRARRKDGNHHEVVRAFESLNCIVEDMTATDNFCDVHVSLDGLQWAWIEIKDGNKKLTKGEIKFQAKCQELNQPYFIVRSASEVERVVSEIKQYCKGKDNE